MSADNLELSLQALCGPAPPARWHIPGESYLRGWMLQGLSYWHKRTLLLLGSLSCIGAQAAMIHMYTEMPYSALGACRADVPEVDGVAFRFKLCGDDEWKLTLLGFAFWLPGWFVGAMLFGYLSDSCGRRFAVLAAFSLGTTAFLCSGVAPDFWSYAIARIFMGTGFGGSGVVAFNLACEILSTEWVGIIGVGFFGVAFVVGEVAMVFLAYHIRWSWRLLTLSSGLQCIPLLFLAWKYLPESPRWLQSRGREGEVDDVLHVAAATSCVKLPAKESTRAPHVQKADDKQGGFTMLFGHPALVALFATMCFLWATASGLYYGLSFLAGDISSSFYLNALMLGLVELPGALVGNVIIDIPVFGRRYSIVILFSCCAASCFLAAGFPMMSPTATVIFAKLSITSAFAVLFVYTAEVFPTPIRNLALGFCSQSARLGSGLATAVVPLMGTAPLLQTFACAATVAAVLCGSFMLETLGRPLPDTVADALGAGPTKLGVSELAGEQARLNIESTIRSYT